MGLYRAIGIVMLEAKFLSKIFPNNAGRISTENRGKIAENRTLTDVISGSMADFLRLIDVNARGLRLKGGQGISHPIYTGWLRNRTGTGNREPSEPFFPKPKAEPFSRNRNRNRPFLLSCT